MTVTPLSRDGNAKPIDLPGVSDAVVDLDADGLLRRRPDRWDTDTDTATISHYYDVAMVAQCFAVAVGGVGRERAQVGGAGVEDALLADRKCTCGVADCCSAPRRWIELRWRRR